MASSKLLRIVAVTALVTTWLGGSVPAASAGEQDALIRAAHFSPDTPGVDVYLTAFSGGSTRLWVPDAVYGGVSSYQRVPAGLYVVAMRPHGAAVSSAPVISWNLSVAAGQAYTTAAIGSSSALRSIVLHDNLALPPAGSGRVRLVQAASRAPKAMVVAADGPTLATAAAFGSTTDYTTVPSGTWSVLAHSTQGPAMSTSARISVSSGSVTSVLLLDAPSGGITIRSVLDAAGASTVPVGAVPAGGGGTATSIVDEPDHGRLPELMLFGALGCLAASALLLAGRRRLG
jgi:hypothetical protein